MTENKITKIERDPIKSSEIRQAREEEKAAVTARRDFDFKQALIEVLETRSGKIVIARLFSDCNFFASSFDTNALNMARKEGKKEFAQTVFDYIMKCAPGVLMELGDSDKCQKTM